MGKEFSIHREVELPATAQQVWDAVTTGNAGWLWPMETELRVGGAAPFGGRVLACDPPRHLVVRSEGPEGWFNQLEHVIQARDGGTAVIRYTHSGVFTDDWDNQYDGADQHTDFYLHTLGQYLRHFTGRQAGYVSTDGPAAAAAADAMDRLRAALGVTAVTREGDPIRLDVPGTGEVDGIVDYLRPNFLGIRTGEDMYRFFGRNAFGAKVGMSVHVFDARVDTEKAEQAWQDRLAEIYA
jgi:uncharacterized protein YndB with AHSA1/START domain